MLFLHLLFCSSKKIEVIEIGFRIVVIAMHRRLSKDHIVRIRIILLNLGSVK